MSASPYSSQRGRAWTKEGPTVADENTIMCMIQDCMSDVRGRKVKDLQKENNTRTNNFGLTPRSRKAAEMQSKHFSERPVSNDLLRRGGCDKELRQSCFMPSEKPAASFLTNLDPLIRKALSGSITADLKQSSNLIPTIEEESPNENTLENSPSQKSCLSRLTSSSDTDTKTPELWSSKIGPRSAKSVSFNYGNTSRTNKCDNFQRNLSVRSAGPISQRNSCVLSSNNFQQRNSSMRRSNGSTSMYPQPMTEYRRRMLQKSNSLNVRQTRTSGLNRQYSENRFDRRKLCSSDGSKTSSASSSRSGESLPVFDLRDLETGSDQINAIIIPGMCNSDDERTSASASSEMKSNLHSDNSDEIECFLRVRRTNSLRIDYTESDSDSSDLFQEQCPENCTCEFCQVSQFNKPIGIVQYLHGDVIKTYDLTDTDAKETEL